MTNRSSLSGPLTSICHLSLRGNSLPGCEGFSGLVVQIRVHPCSSVVSFFPGLVRSPGSQPFGGEPALGQAEKEVGKKRQDCRGDRSGQNELIVHHRHASKDVSP